MKRIKWSGDYRLIPGTHFPFFVENPNAYVSLRNKEVVEVPDEVAQELYDKGTGVEFVDEMSEPKKHGRKKTDINEVTSFDND